MAAKLKDGVFLGDFEAAQDLEFIVANKITRIINTVGREIANSWERSGIRYLTYYWPESGNCIVFDETNTVLDEIYSFIEEALDVGESVLIHSTDGVSRASFCACVYFMLKYRWALSKTFNYLISKRPDLQPKPGFMRQLQALDASLQKVARQNARGPNDPALRRCSEWDPTLITPDPANNGIPNFDDDEAMLVHTYLNSQAVPEEMVIAAQSSTPIVRPGQASRGGKRRGLSWIDDSKRASTTHNDVPISPGSKRPTVERPPSASYNSLALGPGWTDPTGAAQALGRGAGPLVAPAVGGMVSAAAAMLPQPVGYHGQPRSILKGSLTWAEDRKGRRSSTLSEGSGEGAAQQGGAGLGSTAGAPPGSARGRAEQQATGRQTPQQQQQQDGERTSRPGSAANNTTNTNSVSTASLSSSSAQAAQWSVTSVGQGAAGAAQQAQPERGVSVSQNSRGSSSASASGPALGPGSSGAALGQSMGMGMMGATGPGPVRAVHGAVKAAHGPTDLGATFGAPNQRGNNLLADSLASLNAGNLSKSLGPQSSGVGQTNFGATAGPNSGLAATLAAATMSGSNASSMLGGSNGSIQLNQLPARNASNRVRGYSPGPGRLKGGTGPSGGPAQGGSGSRNSVNSIDDDSPMAASALGRGLSGGHAGQGRPTSGSGRGTASQQGQGVGGYGASSGAGSTGVIPQMQVRSSGLVQYVSANAAQGLGGTMGGGLGGSFQQQGGQGQGQGYGGSFAMPGAGSNMNLLGSSYGYGNNNGGGNGGAGGLGSSFGGQGLGASYGQQGGQGQGQAGFSRTPSASQLATAAYGMQGPLSSASASGRPGSASRPAGPGSAVGSMPGSTAANSMGMGMGMGGTPGRPGSGRPQMPGSVMGAGSVPGHSTVQLSSTPGALGMGGAASRQASAGGTPSKGGASASVAAAAAAGMGTYSSRQSAPVANGYGDDGWGSRGSGAGAMPGGGAGQGLKSSQGQGMSYGGTPNGKTGASSGMAGGAGGSRPVSAVATYSSQAGPQPVAQTRPGSQPLSSTNAAAAAYGFNSSYGQQGTPGRPGVNALGASMQGPFNGSFGQSGAAGVVASTRPTSSGSTTGGRMGQGGPGSSVNGVWTGAGVVGNQGGRR